MSTFVGSFPSWSTTLLSWGNSMAKRIGAVTIPWRISDYWLMENWNNSIEYRSSVYMYREYTRLERDIYESYDRVINEILTTSNIYFLYANTKNVPFRCFRLLFCSLLVCQFRLRNSSTHKSIGLEIRQLVKI